MINKIMPKCFFRCSFVFRTPVSSFLTFSSIFFPSFHLERSLALIVSFSCTPPQRVQLKLTGCQRKYQHNKPGHIRLPALPPTTTFLMSLPFLSHRLFVSSFDFGSFYFFKLHVSLLWLSSDGAFVVSCASCVALATRIITWPQQEVTGSAVGELNAVAEESVSEGIRRHLIKKLGGVFVGHLLASH